MREHEMRERMARLIRRAAVPAGVGITLALTGCSSDIAPPVPLYAPVFPFDGGGDAAGGSQGDAAGGSQAEAGTPDAVAPDDGEAGATDATTPDGPISTTAALCVELDGDHADTGTRGIWVTSARASAQQRAET